jgi:hypothetical protein
MAIVLDGTANTVTPLNGALGATTPSTVVATTITASGVATFSAGSASAPAITTTGDTNTGIFFPAADTMAFGEGGVESMRINSSGQLLINTTTPDGDTKVNAKGNNVYYAEVIQTSGGAYNAKYTAGSGTAYFGYWLYGASVVGSITSTGSSTAYNTSSDYRLKENITPMVGGLAKVSLLKPVTYIWKSNQESDEGFIAHELAEVIPQAVTGEKDAVDKDGNPVYQGIDTSFLVATLTAAIQELNAKFEEYKASHP